MNFLYLTGAENFRMVDIEINAWSSLFLNIETNLILYNCILESVTNHIHSRIYEADQFEILRAI